MTDEHIPADDHIEIKDHLDKDIGDECGYCGQGFPPDEVVIEKTIHGRTWHFCSEDCMRDFKDASDFKDEDLDSKDDSPDLEVEYNIEEEKDEN